MSEPINRRDFLKLGGALALGLAADRLKEGYENLPLKADRNTYVDSHAQKWGPMVSELVEIGKVSQKALDASVALDFNINSSDTAVLSVNGTFLNFDLGGTRYTAILTSGHVVNHIPLGIDLNSITFSKPGFLDSAGIYVRPDIGVNYHDFQGGADIACIAFPEINFKSIKPLNVNDLLFDSLPRYHTKKFSSISYLENGEGRFLVLPNFDFGVNFLESTSEFGSPILDGFIGKSGVSGTGVFDTQSNKLCSIIASPSVKYDQVLYSDNVRSIQLSRFSKEGFYKFVQEAVDDLGRQK